MGFWIPAPVLGHEDRLSAGMTEGGVYVRGLVGLRGGDGFLPAETFWKLPKRMDKAVSCDRCHSQIMGFWIPAFAGMTEGGVYVRGLVGLRGGDGFLPPQEQEGGITPSSASEGEG